MTLKVRNLFEIIVLRVFKKGTLSHLMGSKNNN